MSTNRTASKPLVQTISAPTRQQNYSSELLRTQDITFRYPGSTINGSTNTPQCGSVLPQCELSGIEFSIADGEKVALVGANGSGKSTLLLVLCGCIAPQKGRVFIAGQDCTAKPELARQSVAKLFQDPDNQIFMPSVREELLFSLLHSNATAQMPQSHEQLLREAMESFNLLHLAERAPHHLSVGEKKRVALAGLLLTRPKLLLLDEPTAGLDPRSRRKLNQKLQTLDTGLLMATHDLDMALEIADRVIVLHHGRIVGESALPGLLAEADFLERHGLELPLSLQSSK